MKCKLIVIFFLMLFIQACSVYQKKSVTILSAPSHARIEINGNYVGDTPLNVKIPAFFNRFTNRQHHCGDI